MSAGSEPTDPAAHLWQAWLDWAAEHGVAPPRDPAFDERRARVWEASEWAASAAAREPATFAELIASSACERPDPPGALDGRLRALLAPFHAAAGSPPAPAPDEAALHRALRCFRRREMLRIVWRDLGGLAPLEETLEDLSELADCTVRRTLDLLHAWTRAELGTPTVGDPQGTAAPGREQRLLVVGMGKLGARELNLSSDIDLIFAYPAPGPVVGGPRALDCERFFTRLAQRLIQALSAQTADGFVFRVDARLRPFGDSGPLVMTFDALESYYQSQAREWERYAMIKARVVAGDPEDAAALAGMLRPFVYRRYLDFGAIESLRELKRLIDRELHKKGMEANVKLGPGGIREIEFVGQVYQLVRGGRDPELQVRPIREVLARLARKGLLPAAAAAELDAAYVFLRLVENRIQAHRDRQTHLLPGDDAGRLRLARSMGFTDWPAFSAELDAHRARVQAHFDRVFAAPESERPGTPVWPARPTASLAGVSGAGVASETDLAVDPALAVLWATTTDTDQAHGILAKRGFPEPAVAWERIARFRDAVERKGLSARGRERLNRLMPRVFAAVAGSEAPDLALERVLKVLEAVARRTSYLALLMERPEALGQLARLTGMSPWISDQIAREPVLLDELIDPRRLYEPLRRADLDAELDALLAPVDPEDLEQQMERLRQFAHGNMLRVAAADLTGAIPLMKVSDYLTEIAEAATARTLELAFRHFVERHGRPAGLGADRTGFLVLGYGKLGGLELGYGSDLDLVFVHGAAPGGETPGPKPISHEQLYNRLGQRIIHMMTTRTPAGILYEVDARLRPDGNKGMLVRSIGAFADYQETQAWTWEHQALIRARPVAGDRALAARFAEIRRTVLCRPRDTDKLRDEVRAMRAKMREALDKSGAGRFDLKQGPGGIADIEFMVQYSVLRWAHAHPDLADWTDNIRLLETLDRHRLLPGAAAADLTAAYKALREAYHRSALQEQPKTVPDERLRPERERVRELWHGLLGD